MQVYAATLAQLVPTALCSPSSLRTTRPGNLRCGGESRCKITSSEAAAEKKLKELINYGREYRN